MDSQSKIPMDTSMRKMCSITILFITVLLVGCRVELYSQLTERQANEMLAVLIQGGVDTSKRSVGKGVFEILVDSNDLARAVRILDSKGLPGDTFVSMEDLYKKEGLISSPTEERVRYMFALSQSIAETLTNIDGVLVARVHIALPETEKHRANLNPTSASVFIKHNEYFSAHRDRTPEIKRIVVSSIEGLNYDRVTVFMSEEARLTADLLNNSKQGGFGPVKISDKYFGVAKGPFIVISLIFAGLISIVIWLVIKLGGPRMLLNTYTKSMPKLSSKLTNSTDNEAGSNKQLVRRKL